MKKQVRKLRSLIQRAMPYRFHNTLLIISFIIFLIMIVVVIVMNFIKIEPVAFDENNTFTYTYIEVNQVQKLVDQFYVADDGAYVYLYHDSASDIATSTQKIEGVPILIDENELQKLLPTFQRLYPNLKVNNVEELMKYTGNYYFDYNAPALLYDMQIVLIFSCIPLVGWLVLLAIKLYYKKRYYHSLRRIIVNKHVTRFVEEFRAPRVVFDSLNAAVLFDFLVINHPSPYIIDIEQITWIYVEKKKFFFLFDQELTLVIYDHNLQKRRVLIATSFSSQNKKEMNKLLSFLSRMNSKIIVGYSKHNEMIFHQLRKE